MSAPDNILKCIRGAVGDDRRQGEIDDRGIKDDHQERSAGRERRYSLAWVTH